MPYIWVGRYSFNLDDVALVARSPGSGEDGVTVTLRTAQVVDLSGHDAQAFLAAWSEYTAAREIERAPPYVLTPVVISPGKASDPAGHAGG